MNLFGKRPLALFCALFSLSFVLSCILMIGNSQLSLPVSGLFVVLGILFLAIVFCYRKGYARRLTALLAAFFVVGALAETQMTIGKAMHESAVLDGQAAECSFLIQDILTQSSYQTTYRVGNLQIDGKKRYSDAVLSLDSLADLQIGDIVSTTATVYSIEFFSDNPTRYQADGIFLCLLPLEELTFLEHQEPSQISALLDAISESLGNLLSTYVPNEEGALLASLLLGRSSELSSATFRDFRRTGTTHLLAISGMHLTVLIALFDLLLRLFRLGKSPRTVAVLLFALFYVALTGFSLSAVRALIMCCFLYFSSLLRGNNDAVTSLMFSLFLMLALMPCAVYDIGMWMSCSAVLGILVANSFSPKMHEWIRKKWGENKVSRLAMRFSDAVSIAFGAGVYVSLPMWLCFDELSLVALPAGLLLSPLFTLLLILGPILLILSPIPILASLLGRFLSIVSHIILLTVRTIAHLPHITVSFGYPFFSFLMPIAASTIALLLIVNLKRKRWIRIAELSSVLALLLCLGCFHMASKNQMTALFCAEKDNEFLIFRASDLSVICDMSSGTRSANRVAELSTKEFLATEISAYVFTHYHTRHITSLRALADSSILRTLCLPIPITDDEKNICNSLLALAKTADISVTLFDRGKPLILGNLTLTVSESQYLKRSTMPLYYVLAESYGTEILYISESLHENQTLYDSVCKLLIGTHTVILGSHGPITKTELYYPLENTKQVLIPDQALLPYLRFKTKPNAVIITDVSHAVFPLNKKDQIS